MVFQAVVYSITRDRWRNRAEREQPVRGGTQADIAAAGARELLRRGGNFHMIPVASGTGRDLEPFTNEPLTGFDVRIAVQPGHVDERGSTAPPGRGTGWSRDGPWLPAAGPAGSSEDGSRRRATW